jgi:thioredoxin-like negative regulator of GroEL
MKAIQEPLGAPDPGWLGPCAVLYGASWCQSSVRLRDALARHPHLPLVWADIDTCKTAAAADGIQGIPTVVLRRDGKAEARRIGTSDPDQIIDWLADHGLAETRTERRRFLERLVIGAVVCLIGAAGVRMI